MNPTAKLVAAGLTVTAGLFALIEASGAPNVPPQVKPTVLVPKLAPVRVAGPLPHRGRDAGTMPDSGAPKDAGTPPTMDASPLAPPAKALAVLSTAQKNAFVAKANQLRASLGATTMQTLVWDDNLASFAATVAGECQLMHSSAADRTNIAGWIGTYVGENVAAGTGATLADATNATKVSADLDQALTMWWSEKSAYDSATGACVSGQVCGHFTQVAWAQTRAVGCAVVMCSQFAVLGSAYSVACEFGPGGNVIGEKAY